MRPPGPAARQPTIAATGGLVALVAAAVLVAWAAGETVPTALVRGWRVMVPSTAFVFVCIGTGLMAHAAGRPTLAAIGPPLLALGGAVLPVLTLVEYATGARFGVERALGIPFPVADPFAGRMSPVTALSTALLAASLGGIRLTGAAAEIAVRLAAGTTLTVSWLAVLALSFDASRLADRPTFPGMAVLTVVLLSVSSASILAASQHAMARVRGAHLHAAVAPGTLIAAFATPLALGQVRVLLRGRVDQELSAAVVVLAFAMAITAVLWRTLERMQAFQQQRDRLLSELEVRVDDRSAALALANRQLHDSEARLREANQRKDEFLATLGHELRNPLAPIRTGLAILRTQDGRSPAGVTAHQVIARQMRQLVRLIDDLLDVSRITANKLELRLEPVDLREVVLHGVETSRVDVDRLQHTLSVDVPPTPLFVTGDATRLTQVVANLLQNACKYTPRHGQIALTAAERDGRAEIRVRDNGIGIAAEHLPLLFETFAQAPGVERAGGGLGLGLALVKRLVSLHGGDVDARSDGPGRGSEFVIRLPRGVPVGVETDDADRDEPVPGPRRLVLVVDDNVDNADALAGFLRTHGHEVHTAYDGEDACRCADRVRPDVVLLDLGLPMMSGLDVCRHLRAQSWGRDLLVVAQTGWGQQADRERTRDAGFDAHLVKPVDPVKVLSLMRAMRDASADSGAATAGTATADTVEPRDRS